MWHCLDEFELMVEADAVILIVKKVDALLDGDAVEVGTDVALP